MKTPTVWCVLIIRKDIFLTKSPMPTIVYIKVCRFHPIVLKCLRATVVDRMAVKLNSCKIRKYFAQVMEKVPML